MTVREVIAVPNPVLRKKARVVKDFGPALQEVIDDMVDALRAEPGVGLAASQINVSLRIITVEYVEDEDNEDAKPRLYIVVNPEIVSTSDETEIAPEGCLSVPGLRGDVERYTEIVVKGKSRRGQATRLKLKGWTARIFQHEIDHLDGVLFIDRAISVEEINEKTSQAITT
jgi:peptide deformylase